MKIFLIIYIFLKILISFPCFAGNLIPSIKVLPSTTVEVGEEVFFSATGTTYSDKSLLEKARYEWDFGDGYAFKWMSGSPGEPYYYIKASGIAVTHYFMKPGTYIVTLRVRIWEKFDSSRLPIGDPIEDQTTTIKINVIGESPMEGFEIHRGSFNNRIKQFLYIQIPPSHRGTSTKLRVSLLGPGQKDSYLLLQKDNLAPEEVILLDHSNLLAGNYVVQAELLNESNQRISGGIWRDKFYKPYNGSPLIGIDENNSFWKNGNPFFPIASYMINKSEFEKYIIQGGINTLNTVGYYNVQNPSSWLDYCNTALSYNLACAGPGRGDYAINYSPYPTNSWKMNHNIDRMVEYVLIARENPNIFLWLWQDEPNLGGYHEKQYLPVLAAWSYITRLNDPYHPVYNLFVGSDWSPLYGTSPTIYDYLSDANKWFFGGKRWMQDVLSFDTYPITQRHTSIQNFEDKGTYAAYLDAVKRFQKSNKYLAPFIPALQPCKGLSPYIVTSDQVFMEAWMNVIHGAKGILWFNYFDMANTGRWDSMKKFSEQMEKLAPIVLSAPTFHIVEDNANEALNRVDTMIREYKGYIYIFAVRVTEPDPAPSYVSLLFKGDPGTSIPANTAVIDSNNGGYWFTVPLTSNPSISGKIGSSGEISIQALYQKPGPISAGANTLNQLLNPIPGVTSVTNPSPAIIGSKFLKYEPESINVTFWVSGLTGSTIAEVIDENRIISVIDGKFNDSFAKNAVHIYKIPKISNPEEPPKPPKNLRISSN